MVSGVPPGPGPEPPPGDSRVLVVDDDPDIREAVRWLLEDEGLAVETAADGLQAVERAMRDRPALVVLDMGLPLLSGEEVAAALRAHFREPPPIIVITAAGSVAEKAQRIGAFAYVSKPFDLDELVRTVSAALKRA